MCIRDSSSRLTQARAGGGHTGAGSSGGGASWPWETMVRSPSYAMETVTGECQPGTVRDCSRSMPSPRESASQQYSPYMSSPNAAASEVRSPSRDRAVAMLATPPGLEPMPRAQDSVPRTGAESRPVKMMSRKTVPVRYTSVAGSWSERTSASGSRTG